MSAGPTSLLVADIGGTHARLAIVARTTDTTVSLAALTTLNCADYASVEQLLQYYLHSLPQHNVVLPTEACLAIAGSLQGNRGTFTNRAWPIDGDQLAATLKLNSVLLINDFGALAYSVPFLTADELVDVHSASVASRGPISVMGAGTGFGVALLVPDGTRWTLVTTEGGHVSFAPTSARQQQIWQQLGGAQQHLSVENILSGNGIANIYRALQVLTNGAGNVLAPSEISARALRGDDPLCVETLTLFCEILGAVAGNIALTHGAIGGVYLGGGILPKIQSFFLRSRFHEHFCRKGIMSHYNEVLPIKMINTDYAALTGAAMWHRQRNGC